MRNGITRSGFAYELDETAADNMELVDALADMETGNPLATSRVVNLLLGPQQKKALYDHLRLPDGRVPVTAVSEAIVDIFTAGSKTKNC